MSLWSAESRKGLRQKLKDISHRAYFKRESIRTCKAEKRILFSEDEYDTRVEDKYLADVERLVREAGMNFNLLLRDYRYTQCCRCIVMIEFELIDPFANRSF